MTPRTDHRTRDAIDAALADLAAGQPERVVANTMRKAGVTFNAAWRLILIPSMRRRPQTGRIA